MGRGSVPLTRSQRVSGPFIPVPELFRNSNGSFIVSFFSATQDHFPTPQSLSWLLRDVLLSPVAGGFFPALILAQRAPVPNYPCGSAPLFFFPSVYYRNCGPPSEKNPSGRIRRTPPLTPFTYHLSSTFQLPMFFRSVPEGGRRLFAPVDAPPPFPLFFLDYISP